jgi:hypothetical protein
LKGFDTHRASLDFGENDRLDLGDLGFYRQTLHVTARDGFVYPSYFQDNLQARVAALTPEQRDQYKVRISFSDSDYSNHGTLHPSDDHPLVMVHSHLGFDTDFDLWRWNRKLPGIMGVMCDNPLENLCQVKLLMYEEILKNILHAVDDPNCRTKISELYANFVKMPKEYGSFFRRSNFLAKGGIVSQSDWEGLH